MAAAVATGVMTSSAVTNWAYVFARSWRYKFAVCGSLTAPLGYRPSKICAFELYVFGRYEPSAMPAPVTTTTVMMTRTMYRPSARMANARVIVVAPLSPETRGGVPRGGGRAAATAPDEWRSPWPRP